MVASRKRPVRARQAAAWLAASTTLPSWSVRADLVAFREAGQERLDRLVVQPPHGGSYPARVTAARIKGTQRSYN